MQIKPEKRVYMLVLIQAQGFLLPSESMFFCKFILRPRLIYKEKNKNRKTKESPGKCYIPNKYTTLSVMRYDVMSDVHFPKFTARRNKTQKSKCDFFCCMEKSLHLVDVHLRLQDLVFSLNNCLEVIKKMG